MAARHWKGIGDPPPSTRLYIDGQLYERLVEEYRRRLKSHEHVVTGDFGDFVRSALGEWLIEQKDPRR